MRAQNSNPDIHEQRSKWWLWSRGIWMTHWWPQLLRGMPRVQKIEPVWIGAGQELSGESTNCSKLTFVPPGGMQTGIDRQLASNTHTLTHCFPRPAIVLIFLSISFNCFSIADVVRCSSSCVPELRPVSGLCRRRRGKCWCAAHRFSSDSGGVHLIGAASC